MKRLIVNADDFGIHDIVNDGIIEGHEKGILTSTSLLASGDAFDHAVAAARTLPGLGIGIHAALVGGLKPQSKRSEVSTLLTSDGVFVNDYKEFIKRLYKGEVNLNEVYTELDAQFQKIGATNLPITHVDSHQHMHVLPQILPIVVALMKKYKIRKMRIPEETPFFLNCVYHPVRIAGKLGLSHFANRSKKLANSFYISYPRYFWGMINGGNMCENALLSIINKVGSRTGTHEIMVHPGTTNAILRGEFSWGYHWEEELKALTSDLVMNRINEKQIQLINFKDLT